MVTDETVSETAARLVKVYCAKYAKNQNVDLGDVEGAVRLGVVEAAQKWDARSAFSRYAEWHVRTQIKKLRKDELNRLDALPNKDELTGREIRAASILDYLERPIGEGSGLVLRDTIDSGCPDPEAALIQRETFAILRKCVEDLPKKERLAVAGKFGLDTEPRNRHDLAKALGCCPGHVDHLVRKALVTLRKAIDAAQ